MKKIVIISLFILANLVSLIFALWDIWSNESILNQDPDRALDVTTIDDPLRDGSYIIVDSDGDVSDDNEIKWLVDVWGKIDSFKDGQNTAEYHVMKIIKTTLNRALGMLGLVALVYLLYHGFLMVTASGDDAQFKKGLKWLKYAAIALAWIAVSWFVISFIFWLIQEFTGVDTNIDTTSNNQVSVVSNTTFNL